MNPTIRDLLDLRMMYIDIATYHLSFKDEGWEAKFDEATKRRDKIVVIINKLTDNLRVNED